MKLAEKLRLMSATMKTPEELVTEEIVGFFDDSFRSNEMIKNLECLIDPEDILNRRHECILSFRTKDDERGRFEAAVRFLGKKWVPEGERDCEYKRVNLNDIRRDVIIRIAELAKENFEQEGFKVYLQLGVEFDNYESVSLFVCW